MFARILRPDEYWRARLNMAVAFEYAFDYDAERQKAAAEQPDPDADFYGAFCGEGQPPVASLIINKMQVRFEGETVGMGGVGGVATLPAHRRGGAIRACMQSSLRKMYDDGYALSHLYPFSTAYYRQFGYAPAGATVRWKVRLADLRRLPAPGGTVRQLFFGDDLSPLLEVYDRVYADCNFSALRRVYDKRLAQNDPLGQRRYVFVWYDDSGVPGGFLLGSRDKQTLECCTEFACHNGLLFRDAQALCGLLHFVREAYIANFETIRFAVPAHCDLTGLLPELSGMDCTAVCNGMTRAVNAEKLLSLARCRGAGTLCVQVTDDILPENAAVFRLTFAPGVPNRVQRVGDAPDVRMDVGQLAAALGGARAAESFALCPDIAVLRPDAPLAQVFYRKPCHILDLF